MVRCTAGWLVFSFTAVWMFQPAMAHHPDRERQTVRPRGDLIGPLGNNFRPSYRRELNRPRFLAGKLAYAIAPTSQEAIAWHHADHEGAYANDACRIEKRFMYPKPWEALKVGPRRTSQIDQNAALKPMAQGQALPLAPGNYDASNGDTDPMALSDDEDNAGNDQTDNDSRTDADEKADNTIVDSPPEEVDTLPEPLSSPSDLQPDDGSSAELNAPPSATLDAPRQSPREAIGSGLQRIKERLKISGPANQ
ncbi:hypothetical protein [Planctomycetes bacterium K23_9]|uniref:Uncharacterized protein n=1 Tax=Stieleria marina TaxID=1930275 RepID=A0A517NQU8_9BACT|nr:hypothetical protein K239x_14430 [Planctomycetes bacterium K23_9]